MSHLSNAFQEKPKVRINYEELYEQMKTKNLKLNKINLDLKNVWKEIFNLA